MKQTISLLFSILFYISLSIGISNAQAMPPKSIEVVDGAYIISSATYKIRLTPYGNKIIRLQSALMDEEFFKDNRYEMVESHQWKRQLSIKEYDDYWLFYFAEDNQIKVEINKENLAATFLQNNKIVLKQKVPTQWQDKNITNHFIYDNTEHFTGLGHGYLGREDSIDLKGKEISRNYGSHHSEQAPLIVPFYLSSKGYGVFLNSTFSNRFNFGNNDEYSVGINSSGFAARMDLFFIGGPKLTKVIDNYTQLTGRPRLPKKSMFGLQLSDKGHDHNSPTPSDEKWWKKKIEEHRKAGFPLDHVINDNRWRAEGGKRCESKLAWDKDRYPDPKAYAKWLSKQGLVATLDLNRCIAQYTDGWKKSFNLMNTANIDFKDSAPDLTNKEFSVWFWKIFYQNSLNPELIFPGDALWIDEFDEMGAANEQMILANGKSWAEMRNYWFFLIAKALVEQGWDKSEITDRPFVWVRGMTAGAQRYATLWSGDIQPTHEDMQKQIRAMQLAGISGFPYWGHDAGGFHNWETNKGPDDELYQQWALAFGSFSPIWKPHGMGESRWPLDKSLDVQTVASRFSQLRYQLMPYLYSAAHQAAENGIPITRALLLEYPEKNEAWEYDLQYMWGDSMLIAPNASADKIKSVWLPAGNWYDFDTHSVITGNAILSVNTAVDHLPIYVKAGSIIPKREFALSTQFINKTKLLIDVYTGKNGKTVLIEDDDKTEQYRKNNEVMRTLITYSESNNQLVISKAEGEYQGAPEQREYEISFIGLSLKQVKESFGCMWINKKSKELNYNVEFIDKKVVKLKTDKLPLNKTITIKRCI
jgi:alpha-D-xyloside xylohydrolase